MGNPTGNLEGLASGSLAAMVPPPSDLTTGSVFARLELDWARTARSAAFMAQVREWRAAEPVLSPYADASAIVTAVRWKGYLPTATGSLVLSALLRRATTPWGSRALLQALLPRIRAERVATPVYGHGIGRAWPSPADTAADLVAECFAAIKRHAGQDNLDVARLVLREATRRLRTARQAQRRYEERTAVLVPGHGSRAQVDITEARSTAEWLAEALLEAVRGGRLVPSQAALVYATRVRGLPASEAGRCQGLGPRAVYHALAKAERAFMAGAA